MIVISIQINKLFCKGVLVMFASIKVASLILVLFITTCTLSACSSEEKKEGNHTPDIEIKAGNIDLMDTVKSKNITTFDKEDTSLFESIMNDAAATIPYIQIGETMTIHFSDTFPESYELYDYVLQKDGTMKYSWLATESVSLESMDKVVSFQLKENLSSKFSSNSDDYEPGKLIRGFRLIGKWGEHLREYAFLIKSDATGSE